MFRVTYLVLTDSAHIVRDTNDSRGGTAVSLYNFTYEWTYKTQNIATVLFRNLFMNTVHFLLTFCGQDLVFVSDSNKVEQVFQSLFHIVN